MFSIMKYMNHRLFMYTLKNIILIHIKTLKIRKKCRSQEKSNVISYVYFSEVWFMENYLSIYKSVNRSVKH